MVVPRSLLAETHPYGLVHFIVIVIFIPFVCEVKICNHNFIFYLLSPHFVPNGSVQSYRSMTESVV